LYIEVCNELGNHEPCKPIPAEPLELAQADIDYLRNRYDETVLGMDARVGAFLDSLDARTLRKTIIVLFSEHGEMFAKHGRFGRAGMTRGTHYDDVLHVPLMLWLPGAAGRRISGLAQIIDVMPTLCDLVGIRLPHRVQGRSLLPLIRDGVPVNDFAFAGLPYNLSRSYFYDSQSVTESIRSREWKLIHESVSSRSLVEKVRSGSFTKAPHARWSRLLESLRHPWSREEQTFELYRIAEDPAEAHDLALERPDILAEMQARLGAWRKDAKGFTPYLPETRPVPARLLEDARKRGYW
jgi:iduronate 2-sulfatase